MASATERLVNLALFLAESGVPITAQQARADIEGYPTDQDDAAFIRMFERDKDDLRAMGFAVEADSEGRYWIDTASTFAADLHLSAEETAVVRVVGLALLDDPAFPFADELRFALAKLATAIEQPDAPAVVHMADERPTDQGAAVAELDRASTARKCVEFDYTNSRGEAKHHRVEVYGLFARDGRWYTVGRDVALDEIRVYAVARIEGLVVSTTRPRTPDYERPADFDVSRFIRLPFHYGGETLDVVVRFGPSGAWRAPGLTAGTGLAETREDGSVDWSVTVHDSRRLLRWVVENGPGVEIVSPPELAGELATSLKRVAEMHGGEAS